MTAEKLANIAAAIVGVAMATVIVTSPRTAGVVTSVGNAFSSSLRAAMGR